MRADVFRWCPGRVPSLFVVASFVVLLLWLLLSGPPPAAAAEQPHVPLRTPELVPFAGITSTDPMTNAVGVEIDANIVATYDGAIDPETVLPDTFVAQGMQSGFIAGARSVTGGNVVTLNPTADYFAGEVVRVSATAGISDTGGAPATPYQWQFTAGPVADRCAGGFTRTYAGLTGVGLGTAAWGDYDGDGDLDVLLTGVTTASVRVSQLWRNEGNGAFTNQTPEGVSGVQQSAAAWGDYDNDGRLDFVLSGYDQYTDMIIELWHNDAGGTFSNQTPEGLTAVTDGAVAWGDYDNDGDLDLLVAGCAGGVTPCTSRATQVWRNDGVGNFTQLTGTGLPGVTNAAAAWGDYDSDGDLDVLLAGTTDSLLITRVYRNNANGTFTDIAAGLTLVDDGAVDWGDYDNDGDLDILLMGLSAGSTHRTEVWRNDGNGTFSNIGASLIGLKGGTAVWGDYDNDGDLDILLSGNYHDGTWHYVARVYRNDGDIFVDSQLPLGQIGGAAGWGDYDNDGDLDVLLTGQVNTSVRASDIWRNDDCTDLALSKWANTASADPGGTITCTVVYTNYGRGPTHGVVLTDIVPDELQDVHYTRSGALITPTGIISYVWEVADLAPGAGGTITLTGALRGDLALGSAFTNTAEIYSHLDITRTDNRADARVGVPFHVTATDPPMNEVGVELDTDLQASFEFDIASDTVDTATFTAEGMMGGLLAGAYDVAGGTVTLDPDRSLFPGEVVRTTLSSGLQAVAGGPVTPFQWEFTAGPVISRCVGGFNAVETDLPGVRSKGVAWGDYDRDGYLDLLLATDDGAEDYGTKVYHNEHDGTFIDSGVVITGTASETAAWSDFNNDRYLDILVAAVSVTQSSLVPCDAGRVWRNNRDGTFTNLGKDGWVTYGAWFGTANWMDYDNDGDQDVLTVGLTGWGSGTMSTMWVNDGGADPDPFLDADMLVRDVAYYAAAAWGDYDNDGNVDLLVAGFDTTEHGYSSSTLRIAEVYRNAADHTFSPIGAGLPGTANGAVAWGDYDNDGYVDFLLAGDTGSGYISRLYHNDTDGTFSDSGVDLPGTAYGALAWGDYDNDGDLDFVLSGDGDSAGLIAEVYRNDGGGQFTALDADLIGIRDGAVAWGDYDNDGDLDLILAGDSGDGGLVTQLYRNDDCAELHLAKDVEPSASVPWHSVVTYTVALSNTGGIGYDVSLSDTLPAEVEFGGWVGDAHDAVRSGEAITWTGTLSTGDCLTWTWTVTHTGGYGDVVRNTAWYSHTSGTGHASATFAVTSTRDLALPVVLRGYAYEPDLIVTALSASTAEVRVAVKNVGNSTVTDDFWVDVSFDPRVQPPQINQPWPTIAENGIAWGVTKDLAPGESLELVTGGPYYWGPPTSSPAPYPAGAAVWAYADSVNWATTWGAVHEIDEGNNTRSTVSSAAAETAPAGSEPIGGQPDRGNLPAR